MHNDKRCQATSKLAELYRRDGHDHLRPLSLLKAFGAMNLSGIKENHLEPLIKAADLILSIGSESKQEIEVSEQKVDWSKPIEIRLGHGPYVAARLFGVLAGHKYGHAVAFAIFSGTERIEYTDVNGVNGIVSVRNVPPAPLTVTEYRAVYKTGTPQRLKFSSERFSTFEDAKARGLELQRRFNYVYLGVKKIVVTEGELDSE